jgi:hypothetical protein
MLGEKQSHCERIQLRCVYPGKTAIHAILTKPQ